MGSAPEQPTEQVADVRAAGLTGRVEQIVQIELSAVRTESAEVTGASAAPAEPTATEPAVGEKPSRFVVFLALGGIREHFLGLRHSLVPVFGRLVARVAVGMVLREQLAGCPLDVLFAGIRGDAEFLVEVLFDPFTLGHTASPPSDV